MGYLCFAIALLAGAGKGYCGKKVSGYTNGYKDAMLTNTIRMLICVLIGFAVILTSGNVYSILIDKNTALITILSGFSTAVFVVTWLISAKKGAYMMMDVFLMLSVLVPLIGSEIFFNEQIQLKQWIGLGVLIFAALLMCSYNNSIKTKLSALSVFVLIICGVSCGLSDFSQKIFTETTADVPIAVFNLYTYLFSGIVLIAAYIFMSKDKGKNDNALQSIKPISVYILIMSICLFLNSYFQTLASAYLPSAQLYPMSKALALIISSLMSSVFFSEPITKKCIVAMILSFVGLVIIN